MNLIPDSEVRFLCLVLFLFLFQQEATSTRFATSNKCHASSNRCLTSSNKKLLGTSALLLVTALFLSFFEPFSCFGFSIDHFLLFVLFFDHSDLRVSELTFHAFSKSKSILETFLSNRYRSAPITGTLCIAYNCPLPVAFAKERVFYMPTITNTYTRSKKLPGAAPGLTRNKKLLVTNANYNFWCVSKRFS